MAKIKKDFSASFYFAIIKRWKIRCALFFMHLYNSIHNSFHLCFSVSYVVNCEYENVHLFDDFIYYYDEYSTINRQIEQNQNGNKGTINFILKWIWAELYFCSESNLWTEIVKMMNNKNDTTIFVFKTNKHKCNVQADIGSFEGNCLICRAMLCQPFWRIFQKRNRIII